MEFWNKEFSYQRVRKIPWILVEKTLFFEGILENYVQSGEKFKRKKVVKSENSMESHKVFLGGKFHGFENILFKGKFLIFYKNVF